jgi:hypothetical protein
MPGLSPGHLHLAASQRDERHAEHADGVLWHIVD